MKLDRLTINNSGAISPAMAIREFRLSQQASGNTPKTLEYHDYCLGKLQTFLSAKGTEDLATVDAALLREFVATLQATLKPVSVGTVLRSVRCLFAFLVREGRLESDPTRHVKNPKVPKLILSAFTPDELQRLQTATAGTDSLSVRNRAILFGLLDSGLRAEEFLSLKVGDIDLQNGTVLIEGKGRKERHVRFGYTARQALLKYYRVRNSKDGEPLWVGVRGPLTRDGLHEVLTKLGKSCGVTPCNPHKFRRTFALNCLRNGMDPFSLQILMGHADLQILRRYLAQTQADIQTAHERYSPVDSMTRKLA